MFKFQTLIERLVTTPVENQLFEANPFQTLIERLVTPHNYITIGNLTFSSKLTILRF